MEIYKDARYRRLMCCPQRHDVFSAGSSQFVTVLELISGVIVLVPEYFFRGDEIYFGDQVDAKVDQQRQGDYVPRTTWRHESTSII